MNCMLFLVAGFETSSTVLGYLAHVLCHHPEIQENLANEIQRHLQEADHSELQRQNGVDGLSYEAITKMEYLDQVIKETLRMFPPGPSVIRRQAIQDIQLKTPETTFHVCDIVAL